jgi:deazaflavin-dependent oxidoreductase (nitroreductase family)
MTNIPLIEPRISPKVTGWIKDHLTRYIASNGADGHIWNAEVAGVKGQYPTLLLTTLGRKSNDPYTLPLIYGTTGNSYVIIGSRGGAPEHPAWFLNLQKNPVVGVQVKDKRFNARARVAIGAERSALWKVMSSIWPNYDLYQSKAGSREIPVVVLDPL